MGPVGATGRGEGSGRRGSTRRTVSPKHAVPNGRAAVSSRFRASAGVRGPRHGRRALVGALRIAVEDVIIVRAGVRPLDGDGTEAGLDARDDCVRDPREWSGRWSFIVYWSAKATARILEQHEPGARLRARGSTVPTSSAGGPRSYVPALESEEEGAWVMSEISYAAQIESHYVKYFGEVLRRSDLGKGPTQQLPSGFQVLGFQRSGDTRVSATLCMSQVGDRVPLELHLLRSVGSSQTEREVEILTAVAHYHRTGATLGHGHTVNFGVPISPDSPMSHGLISLPYLDGPGLEWLEHPPVRFLWLIPISKAELEFKVAHGLEALEARFDEVGLDYLDDNRGSVA